MTEKRSVATWRLEKRGSRTGIGIARIIRKLLWIKGKFIILIVLMALRVYTYENLIKLHMLNMHNSIYIKYAVVTFIIKIKFTVKINKKITI